jgi:hypothetical protein
MIGKISFRHDAGPIVPVVAGRMFKLNRFFHKKWAHD